MSRGMCTGPAGRSAAARRRAPIWVAICSSRLRRYSRRASSEPHRATSVASSSAIADSLAGRLL